MKLCASLLLVSAQRVQTIDLIRLRCIQFYDEGCTIYIMDKLKHTRPGYHQNALQLPKYVADEKLCVINCLKEYGKGTATLRSKCDKLLECYSKPHGPASKDTVSRWVKCVLKMADIQKFEPQSFRGASSMAMLNNGLSFDVFFANSWLV